MKSHWGKAAGSTAVRVFVTQVLDICSCDDYNGLDYMAAFFHRWLQEPGRLVFIARMNNRVVSVVRPSSFRRHVGNKPERLGSPLCAPVGGAGVHAARGRRSDGRVAGFQGGS